MSEKLNERLKRGWCIWDMRKKCPKRKFICETESRMKCNHFNNEGGNHWLNTNRKGENE